MLLFEVAKWKKVPISYPATYNTQTEKSRAFQRFLRIILRMMPIGAAGLEPRVERSGPGCAAKHDPIPQCR